MLKTFKLKKRKNHIKKQLTFAGLFLSLVFLFVIGIKFGSYLKDIRIKCTQGNLIAASAENVKNPNDHKAIDINLINRASTVKKNKTVAKASTKPAAINTSNNNQQVEKVIYLTFDDGPCPEVTPIVLNTLKKYNIKATFFLIGKKVELYTALAQEEHAEGHVIGNHTYDHDAKYLYASPENFLADLRKGEAALKAAIPGYNSKLIRFPYGSKTFKIQSIIEAVVNSGYHYVDWNCLSRDAEIANATPSQLFDEVKRTSINKSKIILLMHDTVPNTAVVLPQVIEYFKAQGYVFKTLE